MPEGWRESLRLHHFEPASRANGPGLRAVVWLQGCTLGCPGCFNPPTHSTSGGEVVTVSRLFRRIGALDGKIEGITVSGGEPLQQLPGLVALLRRIRQRTKLSIVVFTGFEWDEVQRMPAAPALLECIDVLIAGRYRAAQRVAQSLVGSANKTFHDFTGRYSPADFQDVPAAEVILSPGGQVRLSGIDPLDWDTSC